MRGRIRPHVQRVDLARGRESFRLSRAAHHETNQLAIIDLGHVDAILRAGIGAAGSPDRSWRQARTALRFTAPRRPVVHYDDLGALALLARIPPDAMRDNADVAAIARLSAEDLETLDAYCATGSLRRAADVLHRHHSSVARRLDQIGRTLTADLTTPTGLTRARLALTAWHLLNN